MTAKDKKGRAQRLIAWSVTLLLLLYAGYQIYRALVGRIGTEQVNTYSVYESIDATGIIFRSETVIAPVNSGSLYYTVENGTRVAKDSLIAQIYQSEQDGLLEQQITALDAQITTLRTIQADRSSSHLTLDILNTQLTAVLDEMIAAADGGVFEQISATRSRLLSLLSKKQLVTGGTVDLTDALSRLEEEKKQLEKSYHRPTGTLKAPVAGYFADKTDGYEDLLGSVEADKVTVQQIDDWLALAPPTPAASSGKIVSGYEWYFACNVPDSYYNTLSVGRELSLRMAFVTDDDIPVTVTAVDRATDGRMAVVFRCAYMSQALSTVRREDVQIQLVRHTGLRVPKRAIVIGEDMQAGVYVLSGNMVRFRKIEQQFSEPADYVICTQTDEAGYLHLYDDVIVEGKGLYDGKIIR